VAGEQYATPQAVELLRSVRDQPNDDKTVVLAAADAVNLCGIITSEPRIPMVHNNTVAICNGRLVGACQAGEVQWFANVPSTEIDELARCLRLQYHSSETHDPKSDFTAAAALAPAGQLRRGHPAVPYDTNPIASQYLRPGRFGR
jgi:hypothetical protein